MIRWIILVIVVAAVAYGIYRFVRGAAVCPYCGARVPRSGDTCPKCGKKFGEKSV